MTDLELLIRDKYDGDRSLVTDDDHARLASGEPLAYVIGSIPFLGLSIHLESKPLIPRTETEWWTERLITHLHEKFHDTPFTFLDLCAGSGAIGLSIVKAFPRAQVSFAELVPEHCEQILANLKINALDESRVTIRSSDLFSAFPDTTWDIIATNPPYIPSERVLDASVTDFEPHEALFSGTDGLTLARRILSEAPSHIDHGELWMELDAETIHDAQSLLAPGRSTILTDLYDRPRVLVSYYE